MDQKIFDEEQKHLTEIYGKLEQADQDLEKGMTDLDAKASEEKNDILTNIRYDTADDEVLLESYGEIQNWNHYIDTYNMKYGLMKEKLAQVKMLLESPYFARVTLQFDPDEEPEDYYIGRASYSENGYDQLIVDWRSPIAETYYNQENGKTSYQVDGRKISVDLLLRRQFDLTKDKLNAYFDTQLAIEDPLLLESLSHQRSDKMQAITTTIQKEQNAIIRYPDVPVMLVNGIAGSGKTSVLLQRIAYLFYQKRKTLRPENVYLLTLNSVFRDYIDEVLPDLGEKNPNTLTWVEFLHSVHDPIDDAGLTTEAESLRKIDELLPNFRLEAKDLKPIKQKKATILSADRILSVIREHDGSLPLGVRLVQVTADELLDEVRKSLRVREKQEAKRRLEEAEGEDVSDETALLKDNESEETIEEEEQAEEYRETTETEEDEEKRERNAELGISTESEEAQEKQEQAAAETADKVVEGYADSNDLRTLEVSGSEKRTGGDGGYRGSGKERQDVEKADRELQNNYGGAFGQTQDCGWLDIEHIGERLLGKKSLTSLEWFYLKMALTGECNRNAEYVCIDEVQDYTEAQLMVLARYFPNAHFMLLGDEFQSIREGTVSFRRIHEMFSKAGGASSDTVGNRSSDAKKSGAGQSADGKTADVKRWKDKVVELPLLTSYRSTPEITSLFAGLLPEKQKLQAQSVQREGTKPVVEAFHGKTDDYKKALQEAVTEKNSSLVNEGGLTAVVCADRKSLKKVNALLPELPVIDGEKSLPKSGAFLIALPFAKGLEFDRVIIPDADEAHYGTDILSKHRLYTAISRATRMVTILAEGELTPLVRKES